MKLIVRLSSWAGCIRNYKPLETEKEYDVKLHEKYIVKSFNATTLENGKRVEKEIEIFSFDVVEMDAVSIKIHTYQKFMSNMQDFIITLDSPVRICTPTKDYMDIFDLKLIK